jgi:hypothetical protein
MLSIAVYKARKDKLFTILETEKFSTGNIPFSLFVGWPVGWLVS